MNCITESRNARNKPQETIRYQCLRSLKLPNLRQEQFINVGRKGEFVRLSNAGQQELKRIVLQAIAIAVRRTSLYDKKALSNPYHRFDEVCIRDGCASRFPFFTKLLNNENLLTGNTLLRIAELTQTDLENVLGIANLRANHLEVLGKLFAELEFPCCQFQRNPQGNLTKVGRRYLRRYILLKVIEQL